MKKILAMIAALGLVSAPVFAQETSQQTPAPAANTAVAADGTATAATGATGFLATPVVAGLTIGTSIAIGTAVVAVAAAVSDNGSSTSHTTTTHH
jgi:predicted lipid-binding transport protein (Tim44 family)